jgi:hypothetical protein
MHTGSCLCGGVRFEIEGELAPIQICHCGQCRRAQGGPFATNTPVAATAFRLLAGEALLTAYRATPDKERVFCGRCGSPVLSRRDGLPDVVRVRAGLIDEPVSAGLAAHFHTASKCGWWPIRDDLPQYPDKYLPQVAERDMDEPFIP